MRHAPMAILFKTATGEARARDAHGLRLSDAAAKAGLQLNTRCGGKGVCESCRVELGYGTFRVGEASVTLAPGEHRYALACQVRVDSDEACVTVPASSLVEQDVRIEDDFSSVSFNLDPPSLRCGVDVPPATLEDPSPDAQRVEEALVDLGHSGPFVFCPHALRGLPYALARGEERVTVTAARAGPSWRVIEVQAGDPPGGHLGVAVDIGTTTVVTMLVDLDRGAILRRASLYNQQIVRADDVASRICYGGDAEHVSELQDLVVEQTINALVREMCTKEGVDPSRIARMVVSGNTVMAHLFLGISPDSIGRIPFQPVANRLDPCRGGDLGIVMHPEGVVDVVPSVAGYVGGDIVSDVHIAGLAHEEGLALMVDIGTNGEMVLAEDGQLLACATAAGPAFEGAGITHGCRAAAGAIERVRLGPDLTPTCDVIGEAAPIGLCGTAVLEFISEGLHHGLINHVGRFDVDRLTASGRHVETAVGEGRGHAFQLVDAAASGTGEAIYVSESDLAEILMAKAAIFAGMQTLLDVQGKTFADVQRLILAGGFARHIDLESAVRIGLLPDLPREHFDVIGNGSLAGAFLALVDGSAMTAYEHLATLPKVVELNLQKSFMPNCIDALALPCPD